MASEDLILDILLEQGKIKQEDIDKCRENLGVRANTMLELLCLDGIIKEEELVAFLVDYLSVPSVTLSDNTIPPEVIQCVPGEFVRNNHIMPFKLEANTLTVGMVNPMDVDVVDNLTVELNKNPQTQG